MQRLQRQRGTSQLPTLNPPPQTLRAGWVEVTVMGSFFKVLFLNSQELGRWGSRRPERSQNPQHFRGKPEQGWGGGFRGGHVLEAHILLQHSTLGSRVTKKKEKVVGVTPDAGNWRSALAGACDETRFRSATCSSVRPGSGLRVSGVGFRVSGFGFQDVS